mgnify:CR=1 FL=1
MNDTTGIITEVPRFKRPRTLPITYYGAPSLEAPSQHIPEVTDDLRCLAESMHMTMENNNGIGLAAPQVGLNIRIVTLNVPEPPEEDQRPLSPGEVLLLPMMPMTIINPKVIQAGTESDKQEEGCLSFPKIYAPVTRPITTLIKMQILDGQQVTISCSGLLGRCLQHEIDHLDGKVFIKRVTPEDLEPVANDLKRLYKRTRKRLKL